MGEEESWSRGGAGYENSAKSASMVLFTYTIAYFSTASATAQMSSLKQLSNLITIPQGTVWK